MRIKKTDIRRVELSDASMLNFLIRQCFVDVARKFGITPENFPAHPSNTTVEIVQKDLSNGLSFYIKIDRLNYRPTIVITMLYKRIRPYYKFR